MKHFYTIVMLLLMNMISAQETTTIYMIRHAEKADASKDTELSEAGKARAEKWKAYFLDKGIKAIYSTPYKRTMSTGKPLAEANRIEIAPYNPSEIDLRALADKHPGQSILIVGHSNTLPKHLNKLLLKNTYADIDEEEFSTLYIITIKGDTISHRMEKL